MLMLAIATNASLRARDDGRLVGQLVENRLAENETALFERFFEIGAVAEVQSDILTVGRALDATVAVGDSEVRYPRHLDIEAVADHRAVARIVRHRADIGGGAQQRLDR